MNASSCPPFLARDQLFIDSDSCDASLPGYIVWLSILVIGKILIAVGSSLDWRGQRRHRNTQNHATGDWFCQRRLPVVLALMSSMALLQTSFLVVTSIGVCNSHNGCALAMYSVMYAHFALYSLLLLRRFIKLGRKVIPLANAKLIEDRVVNGGGGGLPSNTGSSTSQDNDGGGAFDRLEHTDEALKMTVWLQVGFILLQLISGTFLELLIPHQDFPQRFLQITFGLQATTLGAIKPVPVEIRAALHKMRRLQGGFLTIHIFAGTFTLMVGVGVIPLYWYVLLLLMSMESTAGVLTFVVLVVSRMRRKNLKRRQKLNDGNVAVAGKEMSSQKVIHPDEAPLSDPDLHNKTTASQNETSH